MADQPLRDADDVRGTTHEARACNCHLVPNALSQVDCPYHGIVTAQDADEVPEDVERVIYPRNVRIGSTAAGLHALLRLAGNEWGPLGVALAAANLTDLDVLIGELEKRREADHIDGAEHAD